MGGEPISTYVDKIMTAKDYKQWFSDRLSQKYISDLPLRYGMAVCEDQKKNIFVEAEALLTLYSLLVYYMYPNDGRLKNEIDADLKLSKNFNSVKGWLDANGGKKIADEYMEALSAQNTG